MSLGSEIRDKISEASSNTRPKSGFSGEAIHSFLLIADGCIILLGSLAGGIGYNLLAGNGIPSLPAYGAVGLLASLIYILRMNGKSFYDFPDSAKPGIELSEILLCWFMTALLLALFAFLLKIGVDYSRGAFVVFCF